MNPTGKGERGKNFFSDLPEIFLPFWFLPRGQKLDISKLARYLSATNTESGRAGPAGLLSSDGKEEEILARADMTLSTRISLSLPSHVNEKERKKSPIFKDCKETAEIGRFGN